MKIFTKNTLILFVLLSFSTSIYSQITTDRPGQTDNSLTVGSGNFQLETGLYTEFVGEGTSAANNTLNPIVLLRYGLSRIVELRVTSALKSSEVLKQKTRGIGDFEIGAKIQLLDKEDINTKISLVSHLVTPSGSEGFSGGDYGTVNKLALSHVLGSNMGVSYNIIYAYYGSGSGDLNYTFNFSVAVNDKFSFFIEPYGNYVNMDQFNQSFDTGFAYLIKDNLQVDFAFASGINHKMTHFATGISWLIMN